MADINEQEVLDRFGGDIGKFLRSSRATTFRDNVRECFDVMANRQWTEEDARRRREDDDKAVTVFNVLAPMVRAIAGNEIMNRTIVEYVARDDKNDQAVDVIDDAAEYVQHCSKFERARSKATEDQLICGLGATVTYFDYSDPNAPYGKPKVERIFPGFLFYDTAIRGDDLNTKAGFAGYAEPVSSQWLTGYMEEELGEAAHESGGGYAGGDELLSYFGDADMEDVELLYHYEWVEREWVWDIENPFTPDLLEAFPDEDKRQAGQILVALQEEGGIDIDESLIRVDKSGYRTILDTFRLLHELLGTEDIPKLKSTKRKVRKYYKAEIARGQVISWGESWSQSGFTINYLTGYFDEVRNIYYGIVHLMLPVQRAANASISDYIDYLESTPKGGIYATPAAIPDKETFEKARVSNKKITLVNDLTAIQQKEVPQAPAGLSDFMRFTVEMIPRVLGLSQDIFMEVQSGNMTSALYSKIVKQTRSVLAHFFDSHKDYMYRQGYLFLDTVRILAENADGMMLMRLSPGKEQENYFRLTQDGLSTQYDIRVIERPHTAEEEQENFRALIETLAQMNQNPQAQNAILQAAPYVEEETKEQLRIAFAPPPPPQPDPLNVALLQSQSALQNAQAQELQARAQKTIIEARIAEHEALMARAREQAEIEEIKSKTTLNTVKAGGEVASIVKPMQTDARM